jgi:hypothetical protein
VTVPATNVLSRRYICDWYFSPTSRAIKQLDCVWNVMAHEQKPDFVFRRHGRVHLNRQWRQFSRLLAADVCASAVVMLDTPCSEVVWKVLATHSFRQFPLHLLSRASPCAITLQEDYQPQILLLPFSSSPTLLHPANFKIPKPDSNWWLATSRSIALFPCLFPPPRWRQKVSRKVHKNLPDYTLSTPRRQHLLLSQTYTFRQSSTVNYQINPNIRWDSFRKQQHRKAGLTL